MIGDQLVGTPRVIDLIRVLLSRISLICLRAANVLSCLASQRAAASLAVHLISSARLVVRFFILSPASCSWSCSFRSSASVSKAPIVSASQPWGLRQSHCCALLVDLHLWCW